jgi:hypothetical protein
VRRKVDRHKLQVAVALEDFEVWRRDYLVLAAAQQVNQL